MDEQEDALVKEETAQLLCREQPYGLRIIDLDHHWVLEKLKETSRADWRRLESGEDLVVRDPKSNSLIDSLKPSEYLRPKTGLPKWLQVEILRFMYHQKVTSKNKRPSGPGSPAAFRGFFTQTLGWPNLEDLGDSPADDRKRWFFLLLQLKVYTRIKNVGREGRKIGIIKRLAAEDDWFNPRLNEMWNSDSCDGRIKAPDAELHLEPHETYEAHLKYYEEHGAKAYKRKYHISEDTPGDVVELPVTNNQGADSRQRQGQAGPCQFYVPRTRRTPMHNYGGGESSRVQRKLPAINARSYAFEDV